MRSLTLLLALSACMSACGAAEPPQQAPVGARIACAVGGGARLAPDCAVTRSVQGGRTLVTISGPDGGFRRLEAGADGTGIDTADGALHARAAREPSGAVALAVEDDRYRLPAAR